jgi:GT2 family glycosyltransferase
MKLGGWAVVCVPTAVAVHHVGASRRKVAARVIVERHRGMIRYFHKYHPAPPLLAAMADGFILLRAGLMLTANALRIR